LYFGWLRRAKLRSEQQSRRDEVVRRASEQLAGRVLFAPLLWLGNSHHYLDFPGTLETRDKSPIALFVLSASVSPW
jgi:creatinine amidohydrolase/Fe(II)-dependent formamide hydrolase-like protein